MRVRNERSLGRLLAAFAVVVASLLGVGAATLPSVIAQAVIDCARYADVPVGVAPATPAATPAATPQPADPVAFPAEGGEVVVFAAASLTDAFGEIGERIQQRYPNVRVTFNFAGSQTLVTQLREGAPADVFVSANPEQMALAQEAGVIAGEPVDFARNQLTIVVPSDNPAGITTPADLAKDGVTLVLAQESVPAGHYARASLCAMGQDPAFPEGYVEAVASNITSQEEDVRGVLTRVQLGEADAGIVYTTDAIAGGEAVTQIPIPAEANVDAVYPIAPVAGGNEAMAQAFIGYVLSAEGQAVLAEYGFAPPLPGA